jgi:molecular chaperone DnaK
VITVPAYFGIAEREATQQAATIAGIEVLALVDEPVAAAISYGLAGNVGENVLVYDLGGGTFDTTVISIEERGPRVIVTDGVHTLGGILWDERLVNHLIEKFVELAQPPEDPYLDENFLQHVAGIAEELKKSLSTRSEITTNLSFAGQSAGVTVSRSTFELLTSDLIAITLDVSSRALADAKTRGVARIDRIVLVGGSSRMPAVAVALKDRFEVDALLDDPDFAVAKGAAVRAEFLARTALESGPAGANSYSLPGQGDSHGVVPRAVGVLIWDSHDPSGERRIVDHIIKRNEPVPTTATKRFATILEGQDQVRVQIYEQAGDLPSPDPGHNRPVLDGLISNLPKLRAGSPVDVTISLAADGRLRVRAVEPKSGADLTLESFIENIADSGDVERLTQIVGGISVLG